MTPRSLRLCGAFALALTLAACETTPPPAPDEPEGGYRIDSQNDIHPTLNTVRVIDSALAHYEGTTFHVKTVLDVENVSMGATETGFPKLSVELRNKGHYPLAIEARTRWYDSGGVSTDPPMSWTRLFLQPMSMTVYQTSSVSTKSSQYYVEVRAAQ